MTLAQSTVFVMGEPVVGEVVHHEGKNGENERRDEGARGLAAEEGVAKAYAPGDTTLPP